MFKPSPQQQAFFDFVVNTLRNAFLEAVAGAGKTTTILEACALLTGYRVAFAAFNKKIAVEIAAKAKAKGYDVTVGTFHSYGMGVWRKRFPRVQVEEGRKWRYLLGPVPESMQGFVKEIVSLAKNRALGVFGDIQDHREWWAIIDHYSLLDSLTEDSDPSEAIRYAIDALLESNRIGHEIIDFDDMLYLPLLHNATLPKFDFLLVDEAQDTNPARREFAKRMLVENTGRVVFVGDRHQAIYGFCGADNDSVDRIINDFDCERLPLTVTYRCPKKVVEVAQRYVGHIQAHESAPDGTVEWLEYSEFTPRHKSLKVGDAVLCRTTKPLVELAYKLIRQGVPCHVEGRDIGKGLMVLLNKWKRATTVSEFLAKLEEWEEAEVKRLMEKERESAAEAVKDKAETLRVICEGRETLDDARERIKTLFIDTKDGDTPRTVVLSTVHKSKGREWDTVYIIEFDKMPSKWAKQEWEQEQEININEHKTVLRAPSPESTTDAWMKRNTKSSGSHSEDRKLNS